MAEALRKRVRHALFHRHLLFEFLRRDLQARYVGSAMGFFWSVINPLMFLGVYTVVFGVIFQAKAELYGLEGRSGGFALYIFCGLLPWYAFQESLIRCTTCIVDNAHLIKQVRFPAKVLPAYLSLSSIVNQLTGTGVLLIALLVFEGRLPRTLPGLIPILALQMVAFMGMGLFFSTLNTYLRDIGPLVNIGSTILMWASPTLYTLTLVEQAPGWVRAAVYANPVTYLVGIHHHLLLDGSWAPLSHWLAFGGFALGVFAAGYALFTRCHREFADLL